MNHKAPATGKRLAGLSLAALGIVYGDIGTSPIYAFKECFAPGHGAPVSTANVLGVLSLIIWALILIVTIKYLVYVLRADNKGEGGILALLALAFPEARSGHRSRLAKTFATIGIAGACLLFGDGMITPAISVLGAVEGLKVAASGMERYILPASVGIIIALFAAQRAGTAKVGRIFGPITLIWFIAISLLGIRGILMNPAVLSAFNPLHGFSFLAHHQWAGVLVLGSVALAVTGGEALYADMGHFGPRPIRFAWFLVVLPALLLNYLGQGALLIQNPEIASSSSFNPFYQLCPNWSLYPMVGLATAAAIIASQALISGTYSLTMHAIQLGYMPRLIIEHTSEHERGQIYMPQVNFTLMIACIGLILGFKSSENLASAYGVAVTLTMVTTTLLFFFASQRVFGWSRWHASLVSGGMLLVEVPLAGANLLKIPQGGWFALMIAGTMFFIMSTWKTGRRLVWERLRVSAMPAVKFIADIAKKDPLRVAGTAVYMASNPNTTPMALLHNLKHNKVLHKRIIFFTICVEESPVVDASERLEVERMDAGFWRVQAHYGFMESPNIQGILKLCSEHDLEFREMETTFFLSRETVIPKADNGGMNIWQERVFAIMVRNALSATAYFRLPANRVVELGMQVEI
ncbi:MAG: potassium transporter Kup [Verrucomicrobiota bacterium]|nr:potassium transporter Kup [Verrucomicrobiota bacterium]